ncbi:MAG: PAS domain S-box protein [Thermodesulfovibrionales bacterium]
MKDESKTKKQLVNELAAMRLRIAELEKTVSELAAARKSPHEPEEIYRNIFEHIAIPTIIIEEDMTISMANKEAEKLSGYSKEETEGKKKWTEFVTENELERMKEYHRLRSIEPDAAPKSYESWFIDKEGKIKDIFIVIDMLPDGGKRVASLLDISERKQTVEDLRKSEEKLKKKVKEFEALYEIGIDKYT